MTPTRWSVKLRGEGRDYILENHFADVLKGDRSDEIRRLMYSGLRYEQLEESGLLRMFGISFDKEGNLVHDPSAALVPVPVAAAQSFTVDHSPARRTPTNPFPAAETEDERIARMNKKLDNL